MKLHHYYSPGTSDLHIQMTSTELPEPTDSDLERLVKPPELAMQDAIDRAHVWVDWADEIKKRTFLLAVGCLRRYLAAAYLIGGGFSEEADIVGRSLQEDAARLAFLADLPEDQRRTSLLRLWNQDLNRRKKMIDELERAGGEEVIPMVEKRRAEHLAEQSQISRLGAGNGKLPKVPEDADLVSKLASPDRRAIETVAWSSASISAHSSWSPQQWRRVRNRGLGIEVRLGTIETNRTLGLYIQRYGAWLFAAAGAFEQILGADTAGTRRRFREWSEHVVGTIGVRSIEDVIQDGVPLASDDSQQQ